MTFSPVPGKKCTFMALFLASQQIIPGPDLCPLLHLHMHKEALVCGNRLLRGPVALTQPQSPSRHPCCSFQLALLCACAGGDETPGFHLPSSGSTQGRDSLVLRPFTLKLNLPIMNWRGVSWEGMIFLKLLLQACHSARTFLPHLSRPSLGIGGRRVFLTLYMRKAGPDRMGTLPPPHVLSVLDIRVWNCHHSYACLFSVETTSTSENVSKSYHIPTASCSKTRWFSHFRTVSQGAFNFLYLKRNTKCITHVLAIFPKKIKTSSS